MQVLARTQSGNAFTLHMSLESFFRGPAMSHLAAVNNDCDPCELVRDYLPADIETFDDDELVQAVEEACTLVVNAPGVPSSVMEFAEVQSVTLASEDLADAKLRLLPHHGLQLLTVHTPPSHAA